MIFRPANLHNLIRTSTQSHPKQMHVLALIIFFLSCIHFHRDGGQLTLPSRFITDFMLSSRRIICGRIHVICQFLANEICKPKARSVSLIQRGRNRIGGPKKINISDRVKIFIFSSNRKTVSGPQSASYLMVTRLLPPRGGEVVQAYQLPPFSADVKKEWRYASMLMPSWCTQVQI